MGMNGRLLRPRVSGFDPRSISGLAMWLDASKSANVLLNGSTVSTWYDRSGNGRDATQQTAGSQPTFTSNARNGLSALTFGGSQFMSVAAFPVTTYAAGALVISFSGNNQAAFQRGSLNDIHSLFAEAGVVKLRNVGAVTDATVSYTANTFYVVDFSVYSQFATNGTQTSALRLNGVAATPVSYTATASSPADKGFTIGGLTSTVYRLNGTLCEIVYYQRTAAFLDVELTKMRQGLGKKWGVTVA